MHKTTLFPIKIDEMKTTNEMNTVNRFILATGMLCISLYFILIHFTETDGYILGLLTGLGIAFIISSLLTRPPKDKQ